MLWNFFTFEKKFENVQQPSRQANRFSLLKFGKKRPKSFRFVAKTEGKRSIVFRRFFFITKCNEHWSVQFHTLLVVVFHIPPGFSIRVTLTRIPGNPLTIPGVCVEYFACSYSSLHFIVFEQTHTHTHTRFAGRRPRTMISWCSFRFNPLLGVPHSTQRNTQLATAMGGKSMGSTQGLPS